jgi:hypothetical protein
MERKYVKSSNLLSVGYDTKKMILEIRFNSGDMYQYDNVPKEIYQGLMSASSKGSYFYDMIRDNYSFKKI